MFLKLQAKLDDIEAKAIQIQMALKGHSFPAYTISALCNDLETLKRLVNEIGQL